MLKHLTPTQAYTISFVLLAMWAIFAYTTMQNQIQAQEKYAELINISGKQRMLSQRTALLAGQYLQTSDLSNLEELKRHSSFMEKDHQYLTDNLPSEDLRQIYYEKPYSLNFKVNEYFDLLEDFVTNSSSFDSKYIFESSSRLLPDLDYAVKVFEQGSDNRNAQLTQIEGYILLGTILTLILEALLILRPTIQKANLNKRQLEAMAHDKTRKLSQSLEELRGEIAAREQAETERKQTEATLSKANEIINRSPAVAIQWKNEAGWPVEFVSENIEKLLGYTAPELLAGTVSYTERVHKKDVERVGQEVANNSAEPDRTEFIHKPYRLVTKKGHVIWVEDITYIRRDAEGKITHYEGIIYDITDRKKAEEERLDLENQLRQKYKMDSVGVMAGGMAHNFNNNLSIILGNIELSKMKMAPNKQVEDYLNNAKIGVLRSRDLIQQIMTYSRQGLQEKAPTQLPLIVDETLLLMRSTIPTTINLQKNISSDSRNRTVNADASQVQECLINLCNNAMHAMEEKGNLSISLETVELQQQDIPAQYECQPGLFAKLSVQDDGSGMSAQNLDKIFDLFYTTKPVDEGTGVGLSTVQGIVKQHGGLINVNSTLGEGTRFDLYFPIVEQPQIVETTTDNENQPEGTERILFIDDDEMLAKLGAEILTGKGYQVVVMNESTEALKMFAVNAEHFDLVITDQTMPKLCGKDLIPKLREIRPDIPTILCTGFSNKIDEETSKELGINAFLMKPLDLPELLQTVRRVLDGK